MSHSNATDTVLHAAPVLLNHAAHTPPVLSVFRQVLFLHLPRSPRSSEHLFGVHKSNRYLPQVAS